MWQNEASSYNFTNNESIRTAEEQLKSELIELKREIEATDLETVSGGGGSDDASRTYSSVPVPRDPQLLSRERKLYIEKILRVCKA